MGGPGSGRRGGGGISIGSTKKTFTAKKYNQYRMARKLVGGKVKKGMARQMAFFAVAGLGARGIKRNRV